MDSRLHAPLKERNSLLFWLMTIVLFVMGVLLVLATEWSFVASKHWLSTIVGSTGAAVIGAAIVSLVWELIGKRKFADELFTIADLSQSVRDAGILDITHHFYDLPWDQLFDESKSVSVFIAYGRTWRNTNRPRIKKFLSKPKNRFNLLLPNPNDDAGMCELARRFNIDASEMKRRVNEAIDEFKAIERDSGAKQGTRLKMMLVNGMTPTATYYLFDNAAIITTYPHSTEKRPVPAFFVGRGGNLFDYVVTEIKSICTASQSLEGQEAGKDIVQDKEANIEE